MLLRLTFPLLLATALGAASASALSITVIVDTTPIAGTQGFLAFDFIDGDLAVGNTATLDNFGTDGLAAPLSTSGDVTGDLLNTPLVLGDSSFFNEGLMPFLYGTIFGFTLDLTENGTGLPAPDEFSLFLFDGALNPLGTTDPTGANAILAIDIVPGAVNPTIYLSTGAAVLLVPEPVAMGLLAIGLLGLVVRTRGARSDSR